jgi:hypothetical protein
MKQLSSLLASVIMLNVFKVSVVSWILFTTMPLVLASVFTKMGIVKQSVNELKPEWDHTICKILF